jgi:hypothetical protein
VLYKLVNWQLFYKYISRLIFTWYIYHFELILLNYVVSYEEVLSLDMLRFLVVFCVIRKVNCTLIIIVERRDKRVVVVSLTQISYQLFKLYY